MSKYKNNRRLQTFQTIRKSIFSWDCLILETCGSQVSHKSLGQAITYLSTTWQHYMTLRKYRHKRLILIQPSHVQVCRIHYKTKGSKKVMFLVNPRLHPLHKHLEVINTAVLPKHNRSPPFLSDSSAICDYSRRSSAKKHVKTKWFPPHHCTSIVLNTSSEIASMVRHGCRERNSI